jgi:hypothetical protein
MSIYRGAGGAGDAVADSASEALLVRELAIEVQADADAASASATAAAGSASTASTAATNASNSATAAANSASSVNLSSIAITGGSINGTTVGATTASTGAFSSLTSSTTTTLNGTTIPATKTLVTTTDTQTLTNKTLTGAVVDRITDSQGGVLAPISSVMRNRLINGAMVIDQRNAGASYSAVDSTYCLDRWKLASFDGSAQTGKYTVQQNAGSITPPTGFTNYLGITSSAATTGSSTAIYYVAQLIEGFNISDLGWGTASAKSVTLSFQIYSSLTGTFGGSITNSAQNYAYPFTFSIPVANTWTTISVTIAGPTTGTWINSTNGIGIRVIFNLGTGSTYTGTAGSWSANTYLNATGAVNVVGTNGATFYITGVQLEVGSSATGFEYRQYGTELALCQRYYEFGGFGNAVQFSGDVTSVNNYFATIYLSVPKRASPTIVNTSVTASGFPATASTASDQSASAFRNVRASNGTTNGAFFGDSWTASAEL